ncbi:MAG: pilus assembly protein [Lachnospiraceae bacterium]|nr:pilus assembly protein [Lachnospiraceae bacterium]
MKQINKQQASYTIEAAVVMPIFATFMVALLLFFRIFTVAWTVEVALHEVAEEAAYAGADADPLALGALVSAKVAAHPGATGFIDHGILGLHYGASAVTDTDVDLSVRYRITVPVGILGPIRFTVNQRAKHRRWVGYDPWEGRVDTGEYVYIAKYGEDYHSHVDCPYLNPSIRSVSAARVGAERNNDGKRYRACGTCHPKKSGVVYVTNYGESYHSSRTCSALKRTIQRVSIREVGLRRACPKCYS